MQREGVLLSFLNLLFLEFVNAEGQERLGLLS